MVINEGDVFVKECEKNMPTRMMISGNNWMGGLTFVLLEDMKEKATGKVVNEKGNHIKGNPEHINPKPIPKYKRITIVHDDDKTLEQAHERALKTIHSNYM